MRLTSGSIEPSHWAIPLWLVASVQIKRKEKNIHRENATYIAWFTMFTQWEINTQGRLKREAEEPRHTSVTPSLIRIDSLFA